MAVSITSLHRGGHREAIFRDDEDRESWLSVLRETCERDAHLPELSRFLVLNSVQAGMIREASDWRWSSYSDRGCGHSLVSSEEERESGAWPLPAPLISPCSWPPWWEMVEQTAESDPLYPVPAYELDQSVSW